jgi:hypothetical protein
MKHKRNFLLILTTCIFTMLINFASADERRFTYVYEADVLPQGQWEFEQWVTNQNGKEDGDYSRWDLRTEIEYGLTERLTSALYLNWEDTRSDGVTGREDSNGADFKGFSSEWTYQLSNPILDPIGSALYGEVTTDGVDVELEGKLLLSKEIDNIVLAFNAIYEAEWEREHSVTEKEAVLQFTAGASYKFDPQWSTGIEVRNKSAYPDGLDLSGRLVQIFITAILNGGLP